MKIGPTRTETKDLKFLVAVHHALIKLVLVRYLRRNRIVGGFGEREVLRFTLAQLLLATQAWQAWSTQLELSLQHCIIAPGHRLQ
jgi:hypothetical protein